MCGIVGVLGRDLDLDDEEFRLLRMRDAMIHRGPDGEGIWRSPEGVILGHRRLSIIDLSPAESLIVTLHRTTLVHTIPIAIFLKTLGFTECFIGILWLIPALTRYALLLFLAQMVTTFLPLVILPDLTWTRTFVLSLSGQYILKNVVLIASAFTLYSDCRRRQWIKKS